MQLTLKGKTFSQFFLQFGNVDKNLNILKKKMTLLAYVFSKLRTTKTVVR